MLNVYPPHPQGQAAPHANAVWIDMLSSDEAETRLVEDMLGFDLPNRDELSGLEQSSRLDYTDGILRVAGPIIAGADTDHPHLSHIGLVLTKDRLVTLRYDRLYMFDNTAALLGKTPGPPTSAGAFVVLMEAFVGRQADLLEEARARLDQISHRVFRTQSTDPRRVKRSNALMRDKLQLLGRIGERTSMIRESLLGVDRSVNFSLDQAKDLFAPDLAKRLSAVCQDVTSLNQFEEHLLGKVQFLLDAILGFINIEQNDIFKVLTVASVVGIFPTLVAGWYGMNFHNMPEYGWAYGYQFGIGVILVSTILPLLWFKWRGWL